MTKSYLVKIYHGYHTKAIIYTYGCWGTESEMESTAKYLRDCGYSLSYEEMNGSILGISQFSDLIAPRSE